MGSDPKTNPRCRIISDFNSRSPCGERPFVKSSKTRRTSDFNSRSPCGERRQCDAHTTITKEFQLTLPVWGATDCPANRGRDSTISTHAPRVGSDTIVEHAVKPKVEFQLTLPVWGATYIGKAVLAIDWISTHAPRVGSDLLNVVLFTTVEPFQLTLPVWGATCRHRACSPTCYFNSRSPCGERP